jgi:pimeloyl-ACP methyl ester carboxylesterase
VEYLDTGGSGPCVVLVHGVLMNATVWRAVVADLRRDHRCIVPTLPVRSVPPRHRRDWSAGLARSAFIGSR